MGFLINRDKKEKYLQIFQRIIKGKIFVLNRKGKKLWEKTKSFFA
jgi:hypothetical protein